MTISLIRWSTRDASAGVVGMVRITWKYVDKGDRVEVGVSKVAEVRPGKGPICLSTVASSESITKTRRQARIRRYRTIVAFAIESNHVSQGRICRQNRRCRRYGRGVAAARCHPARF